MSSLTGYLTRHIRYKTLAASFHSVTSSYLLSQAPFWKYAICLVVGISLQALANLYNSYQNEKSSAIKKGLMIALFTALGAGLVAINTRPGLIFFGVICLAMSGGYSMYSNILKARPSETPLADIMVFLSFGPLSVFGATYFFEGQKFFDETKYDKIFAISLINGILSHALLWIHRIKDSEKDKLAKKKTTVVLLGERMSRGILALELLLLVFLGFKIGAIAGASLAFSSILLVYFIWSRNFYYAFHFWVIFLMINPFLLVNK